MNCCCFSPSAVSYASFIIVPGRPPTILAEEQDRFEFPDKKVRFRVRG